MRTISSSLVRLRRRVTALAALPLLALAMLLLAPAAARAQRPAPDRCLALSQGPSQPARLQPARFEPASLKPGEVRITFLGHSTFLIESPGGIASATDYNDYIRPASVPDIVTMNRAHNTHYTELPEPAIKHVLRGWSPDGGAARHDITLGDVRVRNVPTNIRTSGAGDTMIYGNSIFVFEIAGLCIGHLGHLHHPPTPQQLAQIGQLDVVMAPVDGSYTIDVEGMVETLKLLRARLILPMHYFSPWTLNRFLDKAKGDFPIEMSDQRAVVVTHASLPSRPKILILPGL